MEPTRPIKTFASWMLHRVTFDDPTKSWDLQLRLMEDGYFFRSEKFSTNPDDTAKPGYFEARSIMGRNTHLFYFSTEEDARKAIEVFGKGEYKLLTMKESPLRNQAIPGNYTLKDMMDTFGDPLPNKIKDIVLNCGSNYFGDYQQFHQEWYSPRWWPEAFIYQCPTGDSAHDHEIHMWFYKSGISSNDWKSHMRGFEFRHANDAMRFKLAFGEDKVHPTVLAKLDAKWDEFVATLYQPYKGF